MHIVESTNISFYHKKISRQCVAILISFTGNNSEMIKIAKYLKKAGIYVIAIGGKKGELQNLL